MWEMLKKNFNVFWMISLILLFVTGFLLSFYGHWIVASIVLGIFFIALCLVDHFIVKKDSLTRITAGLACFASILAGGYFNNTKIALSQQPYLSISGSEVPSSPSQNFHDEGFDKSMALKSVRDEMDAKVPTDTTGLDSEIMLINQLVSEYDHAETERRKCELIDEIVSIEPSSAQSASSISYIFYDTEQFDKAIEYLLRAFEFPDSEEDSFYLNYRLCLCYLGKDDYDKAAYYCDRAIDSKGAEKRLISLYSLRADCIQDGFRKRDYIAKGLALKPSTDEDYYFRGVMFDELYQSDSSLSNFTKAIDCAPKEGKYYFHRGLEQYYCCRPYLAYDDFMQAYSLGYSGNNVCFWIGMSLMAQSNAVEATSYFTRAIQYDNQNWISYFWRGIANLICFNQSSFESALRDFNKLTDNGVYYSDLLLFKSVAELRCKVENWSEDRNEWESTFLSNMSLSEDSIPSWWDYCSYDVMYELIKLYSKYNYNITGRHSSTLYCRVGIAYRYINQYRKAMKAFSRAIKYSEYHNGFNNPKYHPGNRREAADLYNNRSITERNLWLFRGKALRDVSKAISIEPNLDYLYASRAKLYRRKGNYKKVAADYCKAVQIDSSRNDYYYELGFSYSVLSEYEKAIRCFEKAIEIDSTDKRSREELLMAKTSKYMKDSHEIMERNRKVLRGKDKNGELELLPIPE